MALRTPLSTEFWRHCVLNGGTQRRTLPRDQNEEMKIFNFLQWDLNTLVALCHYCPQSCLMSSCICISSELLSGIEGYLNDSY